MAKGVNHYKRDGSIHRGGTHKMPNGEVHSGARHSASSVPLMHFGQLSEAAKKKARSQWGK